MAIYVFAETSGGKYKKAGIEASAYAKTIADASNDTVTAIAINATESADELFKVGVSKVIKINDSSLDNFSPEIYAKAIASKVDSDYVVLSHSVNGSTIAPLLSIELNASLATNFMEAPTSVAPFVAKRKAFSGKGIMNAEVAEGKKVITVLQGGFGIPENPVQGVEEDGSSSFEVGKLKVLEQSKASDKIDLKEAEFVISAGRGMKGPENWGMVEELADLLGAATACSKPVSDVGWRPHSEHVGQTGIAISPDLYIAIGISGAIQHLAGVGTSKTIVVINTDPEAPFFKAADYGIVGDAFDVVPKLIQEIKAYKGI